MSINKKKGKDRKIKEKIWEKEVLKGEKMHKGGKLRRTSRKTEERRDTVLKKGENINIWVEYNIPTASG